MKNSTFMRGMIASAPFLFVVLPFGFLFGVVAAEAGLSTLQTLVFSSLVFAGAAQFTALQLMLENAPLLVIVATALAVNLRMAMYSASLSVWLGRAPLWQRALMAYMIVDQSYICSIKQFEETPDWAIPQRVRFFAGTIALIAPLWTLMTAAGIWVGSGVPDWMALDFALPICFLAMLGPMLKTRAHLAAALTSIILSLLLAGLPANLGLLVAAMVAMIVGAQVELWIQRGGVRA